MEQVHSIALYECTQKALIYAYMGKEEKRSAKCSYYHHLNTKWNIKSKTTFDTMWFDCVQISYPHFESAPYPFSIHFVSASCTHANIINRIEIQMRWFFLFIYFYIIFVDFRINYVHFYNWLNMNM